MTATQIYDSCDHHFSFLFMTALPTGVPTCAAPRPMPWPRHGRKLCSCSTRRNGVASKRIPWCRAPRFKFGLGRKWMDLSFLFGFSFISCVLESFNGVLNGFFQWKHGSIHVRCCNYIWCLVVSLVIHSELFRYFLNLLHEGSHLKCGQVPIFVVHVFFIFTSMLTLTTFIILE